MKEKLHQQGISLFIVMIVVLLTAILVAMSFRSSIFNEYVIGNSAEYQRVTEAAQAMITDAELDINYQTANGEQCRSGCRVYGTGAYFPDGVDYPSMLITLNAQSTKCLNGICLPQTSNFWDTAALDAMKVVAAGYGQYTKAAATDVGNLHLKNGSVTAERKAWYWIELLPYDQGSSLISGGQSKSLAPDGPYFYRVTALVQGDRNARAVIQKLVVPKKVSL